MKHLLITSMLFGLLSAPAIACLTEEVENNNTESLANGPVCSGVTVNARINNRNDVDWFYIDSTETGDISISLSHGNNVDFDWFLYRETGGAILTGETSNNPETGTYTQAAPGRHYIKVTRWSGTGNYQLNVTFAGGGNGGAPGGEQCDYGPRPSKPGGLTTYRIGSLDDTCVELDEPALLLMGGGSDVDAAFSQRVAPHIQGGNIVVLRTTGTGAYNTYLQDLTNAASVETLIVDTRNKANSDYVDWVIRTAEFVFMSGGDQSDYLNQWEGTKVQDAIQYVYSKGGVIGGTSAGNAVLGEFIYDPDGVAGAVSAEVVTDFCHNTINISDDFVHAPPLAGVITDTHFYERDRMGRLMVLQAHLPTSTRGVGVSEGTSLWVTANGQAVVDGAYEVYVVRADGQTSYQQTSCGQPVIISNMLRYKLLPGDTYNFANNSSNVTPIRIGVDGRNGSFYTPSNPY
ncbi:Type 1 glutamine amidotransferase-like domain-containing protein [Salinispirillum sp. LH 10-3-1]|uniref:Type 1 glutamine amidotransferase-like domain-containing protein n=1 Tax=Salinispirillum sp. LH 10-3-1 TaxID=2952525 RepID=A0AB38YDF0_9GAMM